MKFVLYFTCILVGTAICLALLQVFLRRTQKAREQSVDPDEVRLMALSRAEARRLAMQVLSDERMFDAVASVGAGPGVNAVGEDVAMLFSHYKSVTLVNGDVCIDASMIHSSALQQGLVTVGSDSEHAEICVRPADNVLFVVEAGYERWNEDWYPSVFHFLLVVAQQVHPSTMPHID